MKSYSQNMNPNNTSKIFMCGIVTMLRTWLNKNLDVRYFVILKKPERILTKLSSLPTPPFISLLIFLSSPQPIIEIDTEKTFESTTRWIILGFSFGYYADKLFALIKISQLYLDATVVCF